MPVYVGGNREKGVYLACLPHVFWVVQRCKDVKGAKGEFACV